MAIVILEGASTIVLGEIDRPLGDISERFEGSRKHLIGEYRFVLMKSILTTKGKGKIGRPDTRDYKTGATVTTR